MAITLFRSTWRVGRSLISFDLEWSSGSRCSQHCFQLPVEVLRAEHKHARSTGIGGGVLWVTRILLLHAGRPVITPVTRPQGNYEDANQYPLRELINEHSPTVYAEQKRAKNELGMITTLQDGLPASSTAIPPVREFLKVHLNLRSQILNFNA